MCQPLLRDRNPSSSVWGFDESSGFLDECQKACDRYSHNSRLPKDVPLQNSSLWQSSPCLG